LEAGFEYVCDMENGECPSHAKKKDEKRKVKFKMLCS
jgi:hypothetical protein